VNAWTEIKKRMNGRWTFVQRAELIGHRRMVSSISAWALFCETPRKNRKS
jgi:hypothetical protein